MDQTEFRVPPKLIIQIWDNDKFSLDDYLGKAYLWILFSEKLCLKLEKAIKTWNQLFNSPVLWGGVPPGVPPPAWMSPERGGLPVRCPGPLRSGHSDWRCGPQPLPGPLHQLLSC